MASAPWCDRVGKLSTLDGMTAEKVNVSGQCVEAGKIQVTVTPKDTTATAFFIKAELVK